MIRKSRKSDLEHYQRSAGGEYIYTGGYVSFVDQGKGRKRALTELWCITAGIGVGAVGCGCISAPGTQNTFYVLLPLMIAIITAMACLWTLGQVSAGGDPMKEYVYRDSVLKMQGRFTAAAVFAGITAAAELLFLIIHGAWCVSALAVVVLEAVVCGLCILGKRLFSGLKWQKSAETRG